MTGYSGDLRLFPSNGHIAFIILLFQFVGPVTGWNTINGLRSAISLTLLFIKPTRTTKVKMEINEKAELKAFFISKTCYIDFLIEYKRKKVYIFII